MATANDAESDGISEEIELLQAIYVHELELSGLEERPTLVSLFLHPSTGDDDHNSKYVCLNLSLSISDKYPFLSPGISIKNPRGLSDAHVASIQENLCALAKEKIGSPMLYDLIEYAKECLSDNNIPSCPCVICQEHFGKEEKFVKTDCYHYFHSVCLANYVDHFLSENQNKKIVCPMCRVDIVYNKNEYDNEVNNGCTEEIFVYKPDKEQLKAQAERQRIFEYQKHKGGIINIEKERNKYLIGIKDRKEGESESNDVQSDRISIHVPQGISGATEIFLNSVSSHTEDQGCRDQITDEGKRNKDKNQTRGSMAEGQSESQTSVTEKRERRRDTEGQRRTQVSERGDSGVNKGKNTLIGEAKGPVDPGSSGYGKGDKKDPVEFRRNNESPRGKPQTNTGSESKGQYKKYSRVLDKGEKPAPQRKFRNSPSPSYDQRRNSGKSEERKESMDQVVEDKKKPYKPAKAEMPRNERDFNWRRKGGGSEEKDRGKEQAKEGKGENVRSKDHEKTKDGEDQGRNKYQTNELKSSSTSSNPQGRNVEETKRLAEYGCTNAKNINNNSTSKQTKDKQTDRKQNLRKPRRTPTPRKFREDYKPPVERSCQKSSNSVTSGTNHHAESVKRSEKTDKRNDSFVSETDKKSLKKSDKNLPGKTEKGSSNIGDNVVNNDGGDVQGNKHQIRRPPPGFENVRPDNSLSTEQPGQTASDPSVTRCKPRRAPPGFENVKPSNKKL